MHLQLLKILPQTTTKNTIIYLKLYAVSLTHPPSQCTSEALSPEEKQLGRETNHSSPCSSKVKNEWIYTSSLHGVQRDNFTFTHMNVTNGTWR
jgi:hypothetical protein